MPDEQATVTIADVELVRTGTWAASTGVTPVTQAHLESMVAAAADPEIDKAPLKLGHTGALSDLGDSTPGFGWASNYRVRDNGDGTHTLVGDFAGVPVAMKDAIQAGFPRRSIEIDWDVTTPAGNEYAAVLSATALLGVQPPAVKGLADIASLYKPMKTAASGLKVGSSSMLALWDAVPGDEITLQERVRDQLRWARESAASLAALVGLDGLQLVFDALDAMAARADGRGIDAMAADHGRDLATLSQGGHVADDNDKAPTLPELRKALGLPDDATAETVTATLSELKTKQDEAAAAAKGAAGGEVEAGKELASALSADTMKVLKDAGLTVVTDSAFSELQANAALGAQAATQLAAQKRDDVLDQAQRLGKFGGGDQAQTTRSKFAALLEKDFDGTVAVLDTLTAIAPTVELGSDNPGAQLAAAEADAALDLEIAQLFAGEIPTVAKEA